MALSWVSFRRVKSPGASGSFCVSVYPALGRFLRKILCLQCSILFGVVSGMCRSGGLVCTRSVDSSLASRSLFGSWVGVRSLCDVLWDLVRDFCSRSMHVLESEEEVALPRVLREGWVRLELGFRRACF